jgi:hypothetical protein
MKHKVFAAEDLLSRLERLNHSVIPKGFDAFSEFLRDRQRLKSQYAELVKLKPEFQERYSAQLRQAERDVAKAVAEHFDASIMYFFLAAVEALEFRDVDEDED